MTDSEILAELERRFDEYADDQYNDDGGRIAFHMAIEWIREMRGLPPISRLYRGYKRPGV